MPQGGTMTAGLPATERGTPADNDNPTAKGNNHSET